MTAPAQQAVRSAEFARLEGQVYVDDQRAEAHAAVPDKSVVRTADGRAEIRVRSGALFLGENSAIRIFENQSYNFNRMEMIRGSALIQTAANIGLVVCEDTVSLSDSGIFRLDLQRISQSPYGENDCRFRVFRGAASVQLPSFAVPLRAGETMGLNRRCGDMIPTEEFKLSVEDDLLKWAGVARPR
jgi:hypothetical protein